MSALKTVARLDGSHICACPVEKYEELLSTKLGTLTSLFPSFPQDKIEVFKSPPINFRNRANFIVWRDRKGDNSPDALYYGMYEPADQEATPGTAGQTKKEKRVAKAKAKGPKVVRPIMQIKSFPRGAVLIDKMMQELMLYVQGKAGPAGAVAADDAARCLLRGDMFEVRLVSTQMNHAIVVLLYHCTLDAGKWCDAARGLLEWLQRPEMGAAQESGAVRLIARARKQKMYVTSTHSSATDPPDENPYAERVTLANLEKELVVETYHVGGRPFLNYQIEGAFSQPNAAVCEKMLYWSQQCTTPTYAHDQKGVPCVPSSSSSPSPRAEDLVELYCGGGTFTAVLAQNFRTVLATELSKASVVLAKKTFADNDIHNVTVAPMSAEEFSDMYEKHRAGKLNGGVGTMGNDSGNAQFRWDNLSSFDNISTAFVDPPRAGCDDATCALLAKFDKICYISCNPATLQSDVAKIVAAVGPGTSSATAAGGDNALYRHKIVRMAAFDQFPYTHHLESGVMLVKERLSDAEVAEELANRAALAEKEKNVRDDSETNVGEKRKIGE